jgi:CBS domain-containing protein
MSEPRVRDVMHAGVISCPPDTGLDDVAALMRENGVSALVVVDDGVAAGVISQTDLVNAAFVQPYMRYWRGMAARHLMTSPVVSVGPDTTLADAVELLRARKIHRLVVTEPVAAGERPIGILSTTDLVRVFGSGPQDADAARSELTS